MSKTTTAQRYARAINDAYMGTDNEYRNLEDFLDSFTLESNIITNTETGQRVGVMVLIAMGGPTVWIDTYNQIVIATEGGAGYSVADLRRDVCEEINMFFGVDY